MKIKGLECDKRQTGVLLLRKISTTSRDEALHDRRGSTYVNSLVLLLTVLTVVLIIGGTLGSVIWSLQMELKELQQENFRLKSTRPSDSDYLDLAVSLVTGVKNY